ncbi:MAG TPA: class I SAM-dependent methyltransferase [Mycobacteriales bacterium]|nr:class I SAM-dependent methyltransferase [Mycobacteriales bacterium]
MPTSPAQAPPDLAALAGQFGRPEQPAEHDDVARCEALRAQLLTRDEPVGDVFETSSGRSDATTIAAETANASCPPDKALFLYRLVRALRPELVVEFGSALGVSGAYLASALTANGSGRLVTVEGSPSRQQVAAASIESVAPGVTTSVCGYFDDHLDVLDGATLFFNDGNHQEDAVLRYASAAAERMGRPGVLVIDDIVGYSAGMASAWRKLQRDRRFTRGVTAGRMALVALADAQRPRRSWLRWGRRGG